MERNKYTTPRNFINCCQELKTSLKDVDGKLRFISDLTGEEVVMVMIHPDGAPKNPRSGIKYVKTEKELNELGFGLNLRSDAKEMIYELKNNT